MNSTGNLTEFLIKSLIKQDDKVKLPITNTRIGDKDLNIFGGSYHIPDNKYETFLNIYYHNFRNIMILIYKSDSKHHFSLYFSFAYIVFQSFFMFYLIYICNKSKVNMNFFYLIIFKISNLIYN